MTTHGLHAQLVALSRVCDTLATDARTPAHGRAIDAVGRVLWRQARAVKRVVDEMGPVEADLPMPADPFVFEQPGATS